MIYGFRCAVPEHLTCLQQPCCFYSENKQEVERVKKKLFASCDSYVCIDEEFDPNEEFVTAEYEPDMKFRYKKDLVVHLYKDTHNGIPMSEDGRTPAEEETIIFYDTILERYFKNDWTQVLWEDVCDWKYLN